jgi:hypothetical protein
MLGVIIAIGAPITDSVLTSAERKLGFCLIEMTCKDCQALREKFGTLRLKEALHALGQSASALAIESFIIQTRILSYVELKRDIEGCNLAIGRTCDDCKKNGSDETMSMSVSEEELRKARDTSKSSIVAFFEGRIPTIPGCPHE